MTSTINKPTFVSSSKEVNSIVGQIEKQQIAVGNHLQNVVLAGKEKVKNIREYMESQRNYVWENWRASNLIQAILLNDPIPEIIIYRNDDKSQFRKTLDGQQRLTTIYLFVNNGFKLDLSKSIYPTFEIEGEQYTYQNLQDKLFSELPELLRDIILNYDLRILTANNCSDEQAERYYTSMNAGMKPLKPAEIRMAGMGIKVRRFIAETLKSDWLLHCLTPKAVITNTGSEVISHLITLMHSSSPIELSKENIDNVIYSFRDNGVPEQMKEDIVNVGSFLNDVTSIWIEDKKKQDELKVKGKKVSNYATYRFSFFNKTNTVMLMMAADQAIKNSVSVEEFAKWSYKFFDNPSEDYKKGMTGKVNELQMVDFRMLAIQEEVSKLKKGEVKDVVKKATAEEVFNVLNEFQNTEVKTDIADTDTQTEKFDDIEPETLSESDVEDTEHTKVNDNDIQFDTQLDLTEDDIPEFSDESAELIESQKDQEIAS